MAVLSRQAGTFRALRVDSASEVKTLGDTYAFTFVTARQLAHHPKGGFVNGLQSIGFLPLCHSSYKVLALTLVGLLSHRTRQPSLGAQRRL